VLQQRQDDTSHATTSHAGMQRVKGSTRGSANNTIQLALAAAAAAASDTWSNTNQCWSAVPLEHDAAVNPDRLPRGTAAMLLLTAVTATLKGPSSCCNLGDIP